MPLEYSPVAIVAGLLGGAPESGGASSPVNYLTVWVSVFVKSYNEVIAQYWWLARLDVLAPSIVKALSRTSDVGDSKNAND